MDVATLSAAVSVVMPNGSPLSQHEVVDLGGNVYRVQFPVQNLDGIYQLS